MNVVRTRPDGTYAIDSFGPRTTFQSVQPLAQVRADRDELGNEPRDAESPWLTVDECADRLRLGSATAVRRLIARTVRPLPYHRLGRKLRFHIVEVDRWLLAVRCRGEHSCAIR